MADDVLPHTLHGSGPRGVIALHGWFGDRTSFAPMLAHADTDAFTYAVPDYRGYGDARERRGEYTAEEVAADVLALADGLGWESFSLVGHSMGGKFAQRVLAEAPDRVRALVGVSPVPASGVPFDEAAWGLFSRAVTDPAARRTIVSMTTGDRLPGPWLDRMVSHSLECSTEPAFAAYLEDWARGDFRADVVGRGVPALAVVGANDPALSAEVMRATWMEWFPGAELRELADAGHYAMDEVPLALTAEVEAFLSKAR
ncbi:alpha/beta hydrolase [Nocardiopsis exhalans]|uniref:Alpha/beta hydrolase n=1 Tax=Nocardiopsis exhalans TaxID=163604 RepID=A0ABY5DGW5_9ACTN|nr:alpha/beta hydrolase [Nocardiopsis exhalans]USY22418.1 alpha/beta hydrolase [Nocardiopsis exhalans]